MLGRPPSSSILVLVVLRKWIKEGKIRAIRVGRFWMIPECEVRRMLSGINSAEVEQLSMLELVPISRRKTVISIDRLRC